MNRRDYLTLLSNFLITASYSHELLAANPPTPNEITVLMHREAGDSSYFENFMYSYGIKLRVAKFDHDGKAVKAILQDKLKIDGMLLTTHFASILFDAGKLAPINFANLSNYKAPATTLVGKHHPDEVKYILPLAGFYITIAYNNKKINASDLSYKNIFENPDFNLAIDASLEDDFLRLLSLYLGYGFNATSQINSVIKYAKANRNNFKFSANPVDDLMNNKSDVIITLSYKIANYLESNPNIAVFYPPEGTALFEIDFMIPKISKQQSATEQLVNYLYIPIVYAKMLETTGATSFNPSIKKLSKLSLQTNQAIYPNFPANYPLAFAALTNLKDDKIYFDAFKEVFTN